MNLSKMNSKKLYDNLIILMAIKIRIFYFKFIIPNEAVSSKNKKRLPF